MSAPPGFLAKTPSTPRSEQVQSVASDDGAAFSDGDEGGEGESMIRRQSSVSGSNLDADGEEEDEDESGAAVTGREVIFFQAWRYFVFAAALASCFIVAFIIAFGQLDNPFVVWSYACDGVVLADVVLGIALYTREWQSRKALSLLQATTADGGDPAQALPFRKPRFWKFVPVSFVISIIPLELLAFAVGATTSMPFNEPNKEWRLSVSILYALLLINRAARVRALASGTRSTNNGPGSSVAYGPGQQILFLLGAFVLMAHWLACGAYLMGKLARAPNPYTGPIWIEEQGLREADGLTSYITALYWSFVTISTTGYGDVTPNTSSERLMTVATLLFAAVTYGTIVGSVTVLFNGLNSARDRLNADRATIARLCDIYGVPAMHQKQLNRYVKAKWNLDKGFDLHPVLDRLPPALRQSMHMYVHQHLVMQVPLFEHASEQLIRSLVGRLRRLVLLRGDFIFHRGDLDAQMYFVRAGLLATLLPTSSRRPLPHDVKRTAEVRDLERVGQTATIGGATFRVAAFLSDGAHFGETSLLLGEPRGTSVCGYSAQTDLAVLDKKGFTDVMESFPEYARQIRATVVQRLQREGRRLPASFKSSTAMPMGRTASTPGWTPQEDSASATEVALGDLRSLARRLGRLSRADVSKSCSEKSGVER